MVGTKNINLELHKEKEIAPKWWEKLYSKHHSEEMRCSTANQAGVSVYIYIYKTEIQMASYRLKSQNDAPVCNERKASRHVYLKIKTIL